MYVYVCICMYMYVYVCIYIYVCICMYMFVYVCICMYMYVYVCLCMYMYVYVCICMYMYVYVCICMYMYVYVCMIPVPGPVAPPPNGMVPHSRYPRPHVYTLFADSAMWCLMLVLWWLNFSWRLNWLQLGQGQSDIEQEWCRCWTCLFAAMSLATWCGEFCSSSVWIDWVANILRPLPCLYG